jgi:glutathione S-transferase
MPDAASMPELTLVQYPGFTRKTTLSPPCAKAHMALHFKGLSYSIRNVNTPAQVRRFNPRGRVPVLLIDGEPVVDSTDILSELERRFPRPALEPDDPQARARSKLFEDWADEVLYFYSLWCRWMPPDNYARMKAEMFSLLPRPLRWVVPLIARREIRRRVQGQGVGLKGGVVVHREARECLETLAVLLEPGPFLVGEAISRGDLALAALLDQWRVARLTPDLAAEVERLPAVTAWLERIHGVVPNFAE